ncbi:unnamed protein product [Clonostachys rosea]|uniref:NmrA-like domain-containing protein n=1 Tax=Bionectria ochroleuca TaxID=29856 RepID=A0ABY6U3Z6_BIOOC|nr:unnamed protein product [Clonostachys rosea]
MSAIKNVAVTGASGSLGTVIFDHLVSSGKFNITVLRRHGSSSKFPEGTKVIDVNFDSVDELTAALKGQDALVSSVGTPLLQGQKLLVDAAIAAGVKRVLPSEFGSNLDFANTRKLPVFAHKVEVQDYLKEKAKTTPITYTFVYNSAFLDWGLQHNFLLAHAEGKPSIFDGGDITFSATTLSSVADAVVGVLSHPEETKNRTVFIEDTKITQNKLLELAKKANPSKTWNPQPAKLDDITAKADARLAQGIFDFETFVPYIFRAILDPAYGGNFPKTDNELLGLKGLTDEQVYEVVKKYVQ